MSTFELPLLLHAVDTWGEDESFFKMHVFVLDVGVLRVTTEVDLVALEATETEDAVQVGVRSFG